MNSDKFQNDQNLLESPLPPVQDGGLVDKLPEMSFSDRERELISPINPVRSDSFSFSLENLRNDLPDPHDRVEAIWSWLGVHILECTPWEDRRIIALALLDELVSLSGFTIRDSTRRYFNEHFLNPKK